MPELNTVEMRFDGGEASTDDLELEISAILREAADPTSDLSDAAKAAGIQEADLADVQVSVVKAAKGFGPVEIVIAFAAPIGGHIISRFWDDIIWPRIRNRFGADALGKRKREE